MAHGHGHDHGHDHAHETPDIALRVEAIESLLVEKGLVDPATVDEVVRYYEQDVGPLNGARIVARAWTDPAYKARLLSDPDRAIAELGYGGPEASHMVVVENQPRVHNVVVCTLCSCYPRPILGFQPEWYRTPNYRRRLVRWPRQVLAEFGLTLPPEVEIRAEEDRKSTRLNSSHRT